MELIIKNNNNNNTENNNNYNNIKQNANILVVEDDPINRIIALKFLKKLGHNVTLAENGLQAVNAFENNIKNKFDLILMDVNMPIMDGKEATHRIREIQLNRNEIAVPIIGLTTVERDECINAGMDDHLFKPCKFQELDSKIKIYLEQPQQSVIEQHVENQKLDLQLIEKIQEIQVILEVEEEQQQQQQHLEIVKSYPPSQPVSISSCSINQRERFISSPDLSLYFNINNNNNNIYSNKNVNNNNNNLKNNVNSVNSVNNNNNNINNTQIIDNITIKFNEFCIIEESDDFDKLEINNNNNNNNNTNIITSNGNDSTINYNNNNNSIYKYVNLKRKVVSRSTSQPSFYSNKEYSFSKF